MSAGTIAEIIIAATSLIGAIMFLPRLWRFFVACCAFVYNINRATPTLLKIGTEFSPNHGKSLHDRIVKTQRIARKALSLGEENRRAMADQNTVMERLERKIDAAISDGKQA